LSPLFHILHEDADLLVVNKPAGLVCHPTRDGEMSSLVGRVRLHLGSTEGRLVNRLDRETSGVVLIAKNAETARDLGKLLAASGVDKRYWAIVHGHVERDTAVIDAPLGKDERSVVAIKDCVRADGASARTEIVVTRRCLHDGRPFTWLDVTPETGRKHQIRIHLAHIGHPIVGDKIYGADEQRYLRFIDNTLAPSDHAALMVPNHLLHARRVSFEWRGRPWAFEADPDADFSAMLSACRT
jgi:23S rRNA pseudouridine1911/1915/1917 synthase